MKNLLTILLLLYSINLISGTVRGKIYKKTSKETIEGVEIYLEKDGSRYATARSDSDGKYAIKGLTPGTYILYATHKGMENEQVIDIVVVDGLTAYIDIEMVEIGKKTEDEEDPKKPPIISRDQTYLPQSEISSELFALNRRSPVRRIHRS